VHHGSQWHQIAGADPGTAKSERPNNHENSSAQRKHLRYAAPLTPNAPYLKAVVRESLRLYPPGLALVRFTHEPTTLGEYTLPTGTRVLVSPYLLQRHPRLWPQPDIFRPERFAERSPQQAYLPFGLGPGTCPGKAITILLLHHSLCPGPQDHVPTTVGR
jgi:cytochrome P450